MAHQFWLKPNDSSDRGKPHLPKSILGPSEFSGWSFLKFRRSRSPAGERREESPTVQSLERRLKNLLLKCHGKGGICADSTIKQFVILENASMYILVLLNPTSWFMAKLQVLPAPYGRFLKMAEDSSTTKPSFRLPFRGIPHVQIRPMDTGQTWGTNVPTRILRWNHAAVRRLGTRNCTQKPSTYRWVKTLMC